MIFRIFLGLIVLAPLPLGAVDIWSSSLLAVIMAFLILAWTGERLLKRLETPAFPPALWPSLALFALVVGWACIQMVSLTPESWHHPVWRETAQFLKIPYHGAISVSPERGTLVLLHYLTYAAIFWMAWYYGQDSKRALQAIRVFGAAATVYALFGLVDHFIGAKYVLWFPRKYLEVTSTFINRNNYATYAGLGVLSLISGLSINISRSSFDAPTWRQRTHLIIHFMERHGWPYSVGLLVSLTALLMSQSRAGITMTFVASVIFVLSLLMTRRLRRRSLAFKTSVLAGLLIVPTLLLIIGGGNVAERFNDAATDSEERLRVYRLTLSAIRDQPLLGTGLGSYREIYQIYRQPRMSGTYLQAHNTYLENALELGVPAATLLFMIIALWAVQNCYGLLTRRRHQIFPALGLAATCLVGGHSLVDFSLQIPAVTCSYLFLMGLAYAQSFRSSEILRTRAKPDSASREALVTPAAGYILSRPPGRER